MKPGMARGQAAAAMPKSRIAFYACDVTEQSRYGVSGPNKACNRTAGTLKLTSWARPRATAAATLAQLGVLDKPRPADILLTISGLYLLGQEFMKHAGVAGFA